MRTTTNHVRLCELEPGASFTWVLPSEAEHFSMFEVLHLFAPWDRDPLPDFRRTDGVL